MYGLGTWFFLLYCSFYTLVRAHRFNSKDSVDHTCGAIHGHRMRRHDQELFPRRPPSGSKYGNALQFETGQVLQYSKLGSPTKKFSVDFWMKPEGGQHSPSIILHAYDKCAPKNDARGWFIGLREASVSSDLRIFFAMHTASAHSNKTIMSHRKLEAGRWVHVAATYGGSIMKLYVNQAKVAVGFGQKGVIFDTTTQLHKCDVLDLGGDVKRGLYYRGQIDKLRLWNDAITHRDLTKSLPENTIDNLMDKIVLDDDFDTKNAQRASVTDSIPRYVRSTVPEDKHDLSIRKPPCGKTICDNPEVIRSYVRHPALRGSKHLRIRFINVMNDDGTNPTLTDAEIKSQFQLMESAFSRYNITWALEVKAVRNSRLRSKMVLHECEVAQIGDRKCDHKCSFAITGWDGGDCQRRECPKEKPSNGVCDMECNNDRYDYDGGDCCTSSSSECIDPKSENRAYLSVDDFKKGVGIHNRDALNVYVVNWTDQNLLGTAAFPWEKTVHTELGGVVLPPNNFGTTKVLIHEIGHALGLWHVHHGSTSELKCSDDCIETFPSLELGDLCSDTNATIKNSKCSDPDVNEDDTCGLPLYKNTPYDNYMSYANDFCVNHFTPQQVARMHCYIDLDFQSWQTSAKPSFVPLSPHIISTDKDRIKLSWLPPLGPGGNNAINLCNECDEGQLLEQYATTAYSPKESKPDGKYAAHQAIGPPDADHCSLTRLSWKPDELYPETVPLYLEVGFKLAVVPTELAIWIPYKSKDAFFRIVLIYIDGSTESIGNGTAQCDSPFMKALYVKKKVSKVRIYVSGPSVCIDAVKLTSGIGHPNCSKCKPLHYVIRREPPFDIGHEKRVATARFEDKNVDENGRYEYRVRAVTHEKISGPFSPALIYEPKRGFCGDGKIDEGENCDDGNVRDGDGCNIQCQMEDVFRCEGLPSLCYRYDGDGICEDFEKQTSIKDCGFYTPEGFRDQWVHRATLNPKYAYTCPADGIIGPPRDDLKCEAENYRLCDICGDGWCPSNDEDQETDHWIKVHFKNPAIASAIILYLTYVDIDLDRQPPVIKLELYDSTNNPKSRLEYKVSKICKENPVRIPIKHDMTKPFFKTTFIKMIFDTKVKIAAVSLRSPKYFDPVGLQDCTGSQLFHPSTQKCYKYACNLPKCTKLSLKHSKELEGRECTKGKEEGETCMVQCDKGYAPSAPFELMCIRGEWLVDGEKPRCTPVDCGKPKIPNAKTDCAEGTTLHKKCIYKCKEGTKQSGVGTELSVTCEHDGLWSPTSIFCRRTCPSPNTPRHARPHFKTLNKSCHKGKTFIPGETCSYRCKTGYKPLGEYQNKDVLDQRCLKDGSWSRKRCVPIRCPVRDPNIFRWYNCTMGNKYGSVCRLACPGEKVREVRCELEGKWDKKFQMCSTKGSCPAPLNLNMDLTVICGKHLKPGDECKVTCVEGFTPAVKFQGGSSTKHIKSIMCSPFLQWFPDISEIKCTTKCSEDSIDDGFCDRVNNNEDCQWDGGDCCDPDALKTQGSCGDDCECRDVTSPYFGSVASGDDRFSS